MKNLIRKTGYNSLYFDQSKSRPYDRNGNFWALIDNICKDHPAVHIEIESFVRKLPYATILYEDVRISSSSNEIQEKLNQIYKDCYFLVPLEFYPEFGGRTDILKELLRND